MESRSTAAEQASAVARQLVETASAASRSRVSEPEAATECVLLLGSLRRLLRDVRQETAAGAELVRRGMSRLDAANLVLESLVYEENHLRREVEGYAMRARAFSQGAANGGEDEEASTESQRQARMERLTRELAERRALTEEVATRRAEVESAKAAAAKKKTMLAGVAAELERLQREASGVAAGLSVSGTGPMQADPSSASLPEPLYVLYYSAVDAARRRADLRVAVAGVPGPEPTVTFALVSPPVELQFTWHPQEGVVTVRPGGTAFAAAVGAFDPSSVVGAAPDPLAHLFPDDDGKELAPSLNRETRGRPYLWCQSLAGLQSLHPRQAGLRMPTITQLLARLSVRVYALTSLGHQLKQLAHGHVPAPLPGEEVPPAAPPVSALARFEPVALETFLDYERRTATVRPSLLAHGGDSSCGSVGPRWWVRESRCFRALFTRSSAGARSVELHAYVMVPAEYPVRPPVFRVLLTRTPARLQRSSLLDATADPLVLEHALAAAAAGSGFNTHSTEIEAAVNVSCLPDSRILASVAEMNSPANQVLSYQVRQCRLALDSYYESSGQDGIGLSTGALHGKNRRLPLPVAGPLRSSWSLDPDRLDYDAAM